MGSRFTLNAALIFLVFFLVNSVTTVRLYSQEHPPIKNFQPSDYKGENQNWGITQDKHGFLYVANNEGLLEYDGARWQLYKSPNASIMRSVLAADSVIYAGYHREFGFWARNKFGVLKYTSLSDSLPVPMFEDENVWNIKSIDEWIVFQSYDRIYYYNYSSGNITYTTDVDNYYRVFNVNERLYLQKKDRSVYLLRNGNEELVTHFDNKYGVKLLLNIFETPDKELLFLTRKKGIFIFRENKVEPWNYPAEGLVNEQQVFSGIQLSNGSMVLGTISQGLIVLDKEGRVLYQVDKADGLGNNTVLSLFEDKDDNIWAGLDNGIDCLNTNSYIKEYVDRSGTLGTIYTSAYHDGHLYLGTNQGLFIKEWPGPANPSLVNGTRGQVWALKVVDGDLLCGHTEGTFLVKDDTATLVSPIQGAWDFKPIPALPGKILTGNYQGFSVLEKVNGVWGLRNTIEGFTYSSRFFEIINDTEVWVNHEYKGVFKINVDPLWTRVEKKVLLAGIPKEENSGLLKFNSKLLYFTKKGIFNIDTISGELQTDTTLQQVVRPDEFLSGKMIKDSNRRLWMFSEKNIHFTELSPVLGDVITHAIPLDLESRKSTVSFENISEIGEEEYLIGGTNNYLILDLKKLEDDQYPVYLNSIQAGNNQGEYQNLELAEGITLPYDKRSLKFYYSVPSYQKYESTLYQYRLKGYRDQWSNWSQAQGVTYEKLPFGNYVFEVRARIGNTLSLNTERYSFTIQRPYYISNLALLGYIVLLLLIAYLINKSYKRLYKNRHQAAMAKKQKEIELNQIQSQKELFKLRNEKLNQQIENKNRELAISTMSIVKRNEVLGEIKKELKKHRGIAPGSPVFKLIEKNLNTQEDWNLFENAFNQADNEFFSRLKERHPDLNNNDLKFCAYVRLNLSSKEIATLLNISPKGIEIRRYRLRKKLDLPQQANLNDYILSV